MIKKILPLILFTLTFSKIFCQDNSLGGMKFGINLDLVHTSDIEAKENLFAPREAEITFYGPVNHLFNAMVAVAAHNEEGSLNFELHEAWVSSASLVNNFDFRFGQYFLNIGRLNKVHRHEWPFITAPKFYEEMFAEEGISDSGLEVTYKIPGKSNFSLLAGLASGRVLGEAHYEGKQPNLPTNYLRFGYFFEAFGWTGFDCGLNYLNRIDGDGNQSLYFGFDFIGKKKEGAILKHLVQSEFWTRKATNQNGDIGSNEFGFYLYYQYGFTKEWALGPRLDYFTDLSRKDDLGKSVNYYDVRGVLSLTYQPTEFMRFKLDYSNGIEMVDNSKLQQTNKIELQVTFLLGAHPSHDF